jgi:hypothetical protein
VARWPQMLVVLVLLVATAGAFAVTERLKLERSPITGTQVDKVFSPVCECARDSATISFVLRRRGRVTVDLLDRDRRSVRTLVRDRDEPRGRVSYAWDGRDDRDRVVPEGVYRPRVRLQEHGRTIVLPNPIRVDTTAPVFESIRAAPRRFSPDGDGRRDRVTARYRLDEPGHTLMLVDGRRRVASRYLRTAGALAWFGRIGGRSVAPGVYELRLRAADRAGNRSPRTEAVPVLVRYVQLSRERIEVVAGRRVKVRVLTDADSYRWRFAGRTGVSRSPRIRLRAPLEPGTYLLYAIVGDHADRAEVVVTEPPPNQE